MHFWIQSGWFLDYPPVIGSELVFPVAGLQRPDVKKKILTGKEEEENWFCACVKNTDLLLFFVKPGRLTPVETTYESIHQHINMCAKMQFGTLNI